MWLQGLNVRLRLSTPNVWAALFTKCPGTCSQIYFRILNLPWVALATIITLLVFEDNMSGQPTLSKFHHSHGMAVELYKI
jgi:hypothetical protein